MRRAFTLIELLVVIAILAVLAVVVILTLNPAGLLQESRDANRLQDMATLNSAIGYSLADNSGESLGSANTVYMSVPDPSATSTAGDQCQGLGLPPLPVTYAWHCANAANYRNVNGTGWIPVNLSNNTFGSSLAQLPIDPVNVTSSRLWYTFTTDANGKFEVTTPFESSKYKLGGSNDEIVNDGGNLATVYEKGSKLGLEPFDYGDTSLTAFWTFEEGSGSVAYDYSGNNSLGGWYGSATPYYTGSSKLGSYAGNFADVNAFNVASATPLSRIFPATGGSFTFVAWINAPSFPTGGGSNSQVGIITNENYGSSGFRLAICTVGSGYGCSNDTPYFWSSEDGGSIALNAASSSLTPGQWYQIGATYTGTVATIYLNGQAVASTTGTIFGGTSTVGVGSGFGYNQWIGSMDNVRIYNRALTAAQMSALYSGLK